MKKIFILAFFLMSVLGVNSQIAVGQKVPNFNYTDINGNTVNLYKLLDSGYTVLIDISATWCGPCWSFHNSRVMENLMDHYGPNGTVTPKIIYCIFIEGDPSTTLADLNGTGSNTQGNWVAGANYPIIDNDGYNSALGLTGFPTIVMVCPNRSVIYSAAGYATSFGQESFWLGKRSNCPNDPPASTPNVSLLGSAATGVSSITGFYKENDSINYAVQLYNYSSQAVTSATITASNTASSQNINYNWTGNASKDSFNTFIVRSGLKAHNASTYWNDYTLNLNVTNNSSTAKSKDTFSAFIYSQNNAKDYTYSENFDGVDVTGIPIPTSARAIDRFGLLYVFDNSGASVTPKNMDGNASQMLCAPFGYLTTTQNTSYRNKRYSLALTNLSIPTTVTSAYLKFEYAKRMKSLEEDSMSIFVLDLNTNQLTYIWSKAGPNLVTNNTAQTTAYFPAQGDWKVDSVSLAPYIGKTNFLIGVAIRSGSSQGGGNLWMDNFKINYKVSSTAAFQVVGADSAYKSDNKTTSVLGVSTKVKNIKGSDISAKWSAEVVMLQTGWKFTICDPNVCAPEGVTSASYTHKKDSTGTFLVDFITSKTDGDGYIIVSTWDNANQSTSLVKTKYRVKQGAGGSSIYTVDDANDFYLADNNLYFNSNNHPLKYSVMSLDGKTVYTAKVENRVEKVPALPKGIYLIEVEFKNSKPQILKAEF